MSKTERLILSSVILAIIPWLILLSGGYLNQPLTDAFTSGNPFDTAAQIGTPLVVDEEDHYDSFDLPVSNGRVCTVMMNTTPTLVNGGLELNFTSDDNNSVWVRIKLYDKTENVVGESGILSPGEYITEIPLLRSVNSGDELKAIVFTYDPQTCFATGSTTAAMLFCRV